jgi:hypothetical protein
MMQRIAAISICNIAGIFLLCKTKGMTLVLTTTLRNLPFQVFLIERVAPQAPHLSAVATASGEFCCMSLFRSPFILYTASAQIPQNLCIASVSTAHLSTCVDVAPSATVALPIFSISRPHPTATLRKDGSQLIFQTATSFIRSGYLFSK